MARSKFRQLTFICQTFGIGGAETVNRDLLMALQDSGVKVFAYVTFRPFQKMLAKANIPTKKIPIEIDVIGDWKGLIKAAILWPLAALQYGWIVIQSRQTDLILMSGFMEKILVTPLARLSGIPVVWVEFAPLTTVFNKFGGLPRLLYWLVQSLPSQIIVPTPYTQKYLVKQLHVVPSKISVLPCARYGLSASKYHLSNNFSQPTLVCVSRMEPHKGQDILVKAFAHVVKKFPNAQLIFVGDGGFETTVNRVVKEYRLEKYVHFLGWVKDPLEVMAKATICVFPSVWALEGFGMVTIEAMALAKPIVAFHCGPTPEIIEDGQTGLLAKKGEINDLAAKILYLLEHPQQAKKIGERAQKVFMQNYQFEKITNSYINVFEKVMNAKN